MTMEIKYEFVLNFGPNLYKFDNKSAKYTTNFINKNTKLIIFF